MIRTSWLLAVALAPAGCGSVADQAPMMALEPPREEKAEEDGFFAAGPSGGEGARRGALAGLLDADVAAAPIAPEASPAEPPPDEPNQDASRSEGERQEERVRSWFPEAFLWQPRVETGDDGVATVEVDVPDSLTTWRVLALAHDRAGHQAGDVHTFDGALPLYVDPVVPGWLYAGDRLLLPVQVVNTTRDPLAASLEVEAQGALAGGGVASVSLGAAGSDVRTIPLEAVSAGPARVSARLRGATSDTAEREIPVAPAGRPVERSRTGTLSSARAFRLAPAEGADPRTDRLEVVVFPAPLALLQLELERLGGARPVDPAYGFALASHVAALSDAVKVEPDEAALRRLRILAWQRIARAVVAPDPHQAADLLASLRGEADHPQVVELRPRLVQRVLDGQRADGTWSRYDRSTLPQVLVQTAWAARVLPEDQHGAKLRASAAIERHAHEITDAYTAAVVVASGLADGGLRDELLEVVRAGIVTDEVTGERRLDPPPTALDPWGARPTVAQTAAFAVLALPAGDADRGDLAATLLRGWSVTGGFGAGPADAVALEAVAAALGSVSGPVTVRLLRDGAEVAAESLDPAQPGVPARLSVAAEAADAEFTVAASPEVPGLAFVATRRSWVPWSDADRLAGVDVDVQLAPLRVGRESALVLELSAPDGVALRVEQGLPAGAVVGDRAAAAAQAAGATLEVRTDRIVLTTRPFSALEVQRVEVPVIPAFSGRFSTGPLLVSAAGARAVPQRPAVWTVAP